MTKKEFFKLPIGLYIVDWKDGGSSLAATGVPTEGGRWFAPTNWSHPCKDTDRRDDGVLIRPWLNIERMRLVAHRVMNVKKLHEPTTYRILISTIEDLQKLG